MKLKKSAACIFCAACLLAGCGSESELLSELRAEKAKEPESDTSLDAEAPAEDIVAGAAAGNSETETDEGGEKEQEGGNGSEEPAFIYVMSAGRWSGPGSMRCPWEAVFMKPWRRRAALRRMPAGIT